VQLKAKTLIFKILQIRSLERINQIYENRIKKNIINIKSYAPLEEENKIKYESQI
jgi:hypothetical protein